MGEPLRPWRDGDLVCLCASSAIGVVAIVGAWYGISGSAAPASLAVWLNIAVAGVVVSALGNCVWLMRGRRAVGERRAQLVALEAAVPGYESLLPASRQVTGPATAVLPSLVHVAGQRRVHHADCPLVTSKHVEPAQLGDGQPCGVCAL